MRTILQSAGVKVLEAGDGLEALEVFHASKTRVDLVITDIRMPRMSGTDLASSLRSDAPAIPLILVSGEGAPAGHDPIRVTEFCLLRSPLLRKCCWKLQASSSIGPLVPDATRTRRTEWGAAIDQLLVMSLGGVSIRSRLRRSGPFRYAFAILLACVAAALQYGVQWSVGPGEDTGSYQFFLGATALSAVWTGRSSAFVTLSLFGSLQAVLLSASSEFLSHRKHSHPGSPDPVLRRRQPDLYRRWCAYTPPRPISSAR